MSGDKEGGDTSRALAAPSPLHTKVIVHPIVLLSVVDHCALPLPSPRHHAFAQRMFMRGCWLPACAPPPGVWILGVSRPLTFFRTPPLSDNRLAKDTKKRVVGMLLGSVSKGVVDITNCYAVPFEEDERDLKIWYLDHSYHEQMFAMFKKVNASEKLVGWYSTGPKIKPGDLQIDALVRRYTPNPIMVIIDVKPKALGIPTEAYHAVEEIREGQQQSWTFKHVMSEIGAMESEEVGVEHLLRDVKDMTISSLAVRSRTRVARAHEHTHTHAH